MLYDLCLVYYLCLDIWFVGGRCFVVVMEIFQPIIRCGLPSNAVESGLKEEGTQVCSVLLSVVLLL